MSIRAPLALTLTLWSAASVFGFWYLWDYETRAGAPGTAREHWPAGSSLPRDSTRANLVMAAHPHCPCTRASLDELERLMVHCRGRVTAQVLFFKPVNWAVGWEQTALWRQATAIPDVQVHGDEDGAEAQRFGAATSGYTLLFDAAGRLMFRGGLTNARGHVGESHGHRAIQALLNSAASPRTETAVFGCPLCSPSSPDTEETPP